MAEPFYVAGEWRGGGATPATRPPPAPAGGGAVAGTHAVPEPRDLEDAVAAAVRAHQDDTPARHERSAWLTRAAQTVDEESERLATIMVAESAKPLKARSP